MEIIVRRDGTDDVLVHVDLPATVKDVHLAVCTEIEGTPAKAKEWDCHVNGRLLWDGTQDAASDLVAEVFPAECAPGPLYVDAALKHGYKCLRKLSAKGVYVNAHALKYALAERDTAALNLLIPVMLLKKQHAALSSVVQACITSEDVEGITHLLDAGLPVDHRTGRGETPLMRAAVLGNEDICALLLAHDADVNARGTFIPQLHTRAEHMADVLLCALMNETGSMGIVLTLLKAGARVSQHHLQHAVQWGGGVDDPVVLLEAMLAAGGDVDYRWQRAPVDSALVEAAARGDVAMCNVLLQHARDREHVMAALYVAVSALDEESGVLRPLCERVAREGILDEPLPDGCTGTTDYAGATLLTCASRIGHVAASQALIDAGAGLDRTDRMGWTPLAVAAEYNHCDVARALLTAGAAASAFTPNADLLGDPPVRAGWTPLMYAAACGHADMCCLLLKHGAVMNVEAVRATTCNEPLFTVLAAAQRAWRGGIDEGSEEPPRKRPKLE